MSATTMSTTKRHRDHDGDTQTTTTKRQKDSYINIVHEQQQEHAHAHAHEQELDKQEPMHELSYLFASISPDPFLEPDPDNDPTRISENANDDEDEKKSVIRHLLEASDDELGLPAVTQGGDDVAEVSSDYGDLLCDGLWELEDEVANYYTLLQSELFMQ